MKAFSIVFKNYSQTDPRFSSLLLLVGAKDEESFYSMTMDFDDQIEEIEEMGDLSDYEQSDFCRFTHNLSANFNHNLAVLRIKQFGFN